MARAAKTFRRHLAAQGRSPQGRRTVRALREIEEQEPQRRSSRTRSASSSPSIPRSRKSSSIRRSRTPIEEEIYHEAYVEHDGAKVLIAEILAGTPDDDFYDAKVKVLSEMIKHHVKEEEQRGGLFAQAKDDGDVDLVALGSAMQARKKELAEKMKDTGVPTPATRSMKGAEVRRAAPVA